MARLYADEDFDHPIVVELRRLGHDVLTVQEAGQANQRIADDAVLAFAVTQGRAVLTFNRRDFIGLHRASQLHAGIVVCAWDPDRVALAARIHAVLTNGSILDAAKTIRATVRAVGTGAVSPSAAGVL